MTELLVPSRFCTALFQSLREAHALPRASSPRQRPRNPRQRLCRGLPSAKTPRGIFRRRRGLCRGPFIGHSAKPLPRARIALGKEKTPSDASAVGGFFAEGRPSAKKWVFFFLNLFPEGRPSANKSFYFFFKSLPRASSMALGKEIFRIF